MAQVASDKTLAKAIAVFGGAQVFSIVAALVRSKVAALTIGAAGLGLNALYLTICNFISCLMGCGLASSSIPGLCQLQGQEQRQAVARLRFWGWVLSAASVPVSALVALRYGAETLWLSLAVVALIHFGIEGAVLKSLKATRQLSLSLVWAAVLSVVCTAPFFFWLGMDGVIWSVVLTSVLTALVTAMLSYRVCDARPSLSMLRLATLREARPMFVLGFAFLVSGLATQGMDLLVQGWFEAIASLAVVGLYKAGFQLSVTYTGLMFSAVTNDFYPRLASLSHDVAARNLLVSRQIRVQLCLALPLIALFVLLVPYIIPLLLSQEFLPIVPMVRVAACAVLLKAVYLPIGFLPVAQGRSLHFLLLELTSVVVTATGIMMGYRLGDLTGVGWGLLLANTVDFCIVWLFCHIKYSFRLCFKQ